MADALSTELKAAFQAYTLAICANQDHPMFLDIAWKSGMEVLKQSEKPATVVPASPIKAKGKTGSSKVPQKRDTAETDEATEGAAHAGTSSKRIRKSPHSALQLDATKNAS